MDISIDFTVKAHSPAEAVAIMSALQQANTSIGNGGAKEKAAPVKLADMPPAPKKRGRPPKVKEEEVEETEEAEIEEDELEETEEEEVDDGLGEEEVEEEAEEAPPPAKKAKKIDLNKDLIPALQAYSKKHSREKAGKILAKFKVKSVLDLKESDYAEALRLCKV